MDVEMLCAGIRIPEEVRCRVRESLSASQPDTWKPHILALTDPDTAAAGYQALLEAFREDDMAMLACQLEAAVLVYQKYQEKGIPEEIYYGTMGCFSRFLEETRRMTGKYRYDRAFWSYRQTSMVIFRIGELEYELRHEDRTVSIHIPSDACFTGGAVDRSLELAREFMGKYYPACRDYRYFCHSWLLSPELAKFLREDSNILHFQRRFRIESVQPEEKDFLQWLFEAPLDTPAVALREDTSLQKNVKALLLRGGNIGAACGTLI